MNDENLPGSAASSRAATAAADSSPERKAVIAALKLGLNAARVEMWCGEALSDERRPHMGNLSADLRGRLAASQAALTTALDRHPPEIEEVQNALAAMVAPLRETVETVDFRHERLRTGLAASVTYAAMGAARAASARS